MSSTKKSSDIALRVKIMMAKIRGLNENHSNGEKLKFSMDFGWLIIFILFFMFI